MQEDDLDLILETMALAREKSRGYASAFEWPINRQQQEAGVASILVEYLSSVDGQQLEKIVPIDRDPPDVMVTSKFGRRIGIEVTELVDHRAVERARFAKKNGLGEIAWANWSGERIKSQLNKIILKKDEKIAKSNENFDEIVLLIFSDEPDINFSKLEDLQNQYRHTAKNFDEVYFVLSYDPYADKTRFPQGYPVFRLKSQ